MRTIAIPFLNLGDQASAQPVDKSPAEIWGPRFALLVLLIWVAAFAIGFTASLAMLTAIGFAAAITGLRSPIVGLLGIGLLCTLESYARAYLMTGGLLRFHTFNYWLLIVMVIGAPLVLRRNDPHSRLLQLYSIVLMLGLLFSPDLMSGVSHILNIVTMFGLLVYFLRAGDENTAWYWLGIVNGTAAGVGGLVDWAQRTGFEQTGMDTNAMAEAPLVALYSICLGFRFARDKPRVQALLGFLATINFCWVFLTGSRGGLLVAVICLSLLLWETRGLGRRLVIAVGAALIGIVILTQFTDMRQRTVQRVTRLFDSSNSAANRTSGRSDLATGAWRVFQDHPLGVGTGGFAYHFSKLENQEGLARRFRGRRVQAHSLWTKSLSENGAIGLVVLVGYVFSFAVVGWIRRKPELLMIGLLATACMSASFLANDSFGKGVSLLAAGAIVLLHTNPSFAEYCDGKTVNGH